MLKIVIHWFRQDLRLADNPALYVAAKQAQVLPVYIVDDKNPGIHKMGAASRWWLYRSLLALNHDLNGHLVVQTGDPQSILSELIKHYGVKAVYWNRCYEPWCIKRDKRIKKTLQQQGVAVQSYNGALLWEPHTILKNDGTPYKVFTPFYRRGCLSTEPPRQPLPKPEKLTTVNNNSSIESLRLVSNAAWESSLAAHNQVGEAAALQKLKQFLSNGINHYKEGRDFPARENVSRLSPHLHFGEISPNQVWYAVQARPDDVNRQHFCSELAWREFSYNLLYHFPDLPEKNLQQKFDQFPWQSNKKLLRYWQQGLTGYPIVDAGMRELWQTGTMHNRVRMIVASFLVKNLRIHWHDGAAWFWDCLVDADLANNSASWQWVAGCGADAAPYFRIFNPVTQAKKFDPQGDYIRQYVPELSKLSDRYLHNPWEASDETLKSAGIVLGETYPKPIVDLRTSREAALAAFASLKNVS
ncbi:MAG: deoxyribodipyrimidine photo-lyase [Pseudomonadota bacterium]